MLSIKALNRCALFPSREATGDRFDAGDVRLLFRALRLEDESEFSLRKAHDLLLQRFEACRDRAREIAEEWGAAGRPSGPPWRCLAENPPDYPASGGSSIERWLRDEPVVLRRISDAAAGDEPIHALLFGIYGRWRRDRDSDASRAVAAEQLASADPLYFATASLRLALSCFPTTLVAEIVGYLTAAVRCWWFRSGTSGVPTEPWVPDEPQLRRLWALLMQPCEHDALRSAVMRQRMAIGIALQESLAQQIRAAWQPAPHHHQTLESAMIGVLRGKARYARGLHGRVILAGRALDEWFGDEPLDGEGFLAALAASPWVDREHPGESRILKVLDFGGPMFGVFTGAERSLLRAWLDALARGEENAEAVASGPEADLRYALRGERLGPAAGPAAGERDRTHPIAAQPPWRSLNRRLYHGLLSVERQPERLVDGLRYVEACLATASRAWRPRLPPRYDDRAFWGWIDGQYRKQVQRPKKRRSRPLLSHEAYRFGIEQLAPAILVDGCWLQRAAQLDDSSPEIAGRLRRIFADEMGNGLSEHNHPRVYRRLLESLGFELPPTASEAFAHHPGFLHAAFDLPVFLLAISYFPHRFLPELLGLNLAIELSGLGAAYARVTAELDYWGIDSTIVRLHQSIDNLADGHARLAADCVGIHLDQVRMLGGEPAVQHHWQRIRIGYRSLAAVTKRFRRQLIMRYGARAMMSWGRHWRVPERGPEGAGARSATDERPTSPNQETSTASTRFPAA